MQKLRQVIFILFTSLVFDASASDTALKTDISKNFPSNTFLDERDRVRAEIMRRSNRSGILHEAIRNGRVEDLVELPASQIVRNIRQMDTPQLRSAALDFQPWSDDYWAIYKGVLGARYADPKWQTYGQDWQKYYNHAMVDYPVQDMLSKHPDKISHLLSPAEKYDLLIGTPNQLFLSKYGWNQGEMYHRHYGKVETWMGICHGWAAAAYMMPRPENAVTVTAADNQTQLTFFPSEIKALASLLWSNASSPTRFVGARCNDKDPKKDEHGRILSPACFDLNPGLWHKLIVNQLGISKKSMVIDITYDYEVWNQPLLNYHFNFFNPTVGNQDPHSISRVNTLEEALVDVNTFRQHDKFKSYRNSLNTRYVVGVQMRVQYMVETKPTQALRDSPQRDAIQGATYTYDLELDADLNILGGEWYDNTHPDFAWSPASDGRALTQADYFILSDPNWDGKSAMPSQWRQSALQVAPRGQPLARIVESLIELSNKKERE